MVLNRQRSIRVSRAGCERFAAAVRAALDLDGSDFTVCFISTAEMARLNRNFRGKGGPTDVLSFPAGNSTKRASHAEARYLGDIAIAPGVAQKNAARLGRTLENELRILILHGVLHLLGYDHETDRGQMERLERRLRRKLGLERARFAARRGAPRLQARRAGAV
jgi:probable rRNA maturation factor